MKVWLTLSLVACFVAPSITQGAFDHEHKLWTKVLKKYQIEDGRVRYRPLKKDVNKDKAHPLTTYLNTLTAVKKAEFDGWERKQQMAFLINAYNAFTIKLIIDNYPVKSIKKTVGFFSSPWKKKFFKLLDGKIQSLDPIEHVWLRKKYKEPRVHAAVNCASISCPRLNAEAFVATKLDDQLDTLMRGWMNDPTRNRYDTKKNELYLSKIFDWFDDDFEDAYGSVPKAVIKFGPETAKAIITKAKGDPDIEYLDYNWNLNDGSDVGAIANKN